MKMERKTSPNEREDSPIGEHPVHRSERELIVIVKPEVELRIGREVFASAEGSDVTPLADLLASEGVTLEPLFGENEERLKHEAASLAPTTDVEVPDLSVYYRVQAADKQLGLLLSNPQHPSLSIKKMQDPRNIWEGRVTESYRFTFQIEEDTYILRKVGTHDILKKP